MIRLTQLIDGQAVAAASGRWLELHDPANATVFGQCPAGDDSIPGNEVDEYGGLRS